MNDQKCLQARLLLIYVQLNQTPPKQVVYPGYNCRVNQFPVCQIDN